MKRLPLILLAFGLLLVACSGTPSGVIPPKKMGALMADLSVGNVIVDNDAMRYPNDSTRLALLQSIYARHGVTSADVDSSMAWYGYHLDKYLEVCDIATEILQKRIAEAEQSGVKSSNVVKRNMSADGDSVNLWTSVGAKRNTPHDATEYMPFTFFTDKNWERGDRYTLSAHGVNTRQPLTMVIAADYTDGTTEYITLHRPLDNEAAAHLTFVLDSNKVASRVYGSMHYAAREGEVSWLDSISLVRTRGRNDNERARQGQLTAKIK